MSNENPGGGSTAKGETFVVHPTVGLGDFQTIQAAVDAVLPEDATIVVRGRHTITSTITFGDKDYYINFAGAVLDIVGNITVFKVSDGLTDTRLVQMNGLAVNGDPTKNQVLFALDDAHGYGNITNYYAYIEGIKTFVSWLKYDTTFTRQSNVLMYDSYVQAVSGGATLATTPNAGGSFSAAVAIRAYETLFDLKVVSTTRYGWTANADCDFWIENGQYCYLMPGMVMNGLMAVGTSFSLIGTGDLTFHGNGWDSWDYVTHGCAFYSITSDTGGTFGACRMIFNSAQVTIDMPYISATAVKVTKEPTVRGRWYQTMPSNPALEFVGISATKPGHIHDCYFNMNGAGTYIKLTNAQKTTITGCVFIGAAGQSTIVDSGTADFNIAVGCVGLDSGAGKTQAANSKYVTGTNINLA